MLDKIRDLEARSWQLDPDAAQRAVATQTTLAYAEDFLATIHTTRAFIETEDKGAGILQSPLEETTMPLPDALALVAAHVDRPGLNPASGGHLGYIPGGGLYLSALGDFLADVSNRYAGVFFGSPGAVRMEHLLVRWMADMVGYPATAAGTLLSGGSIANLACIVTARDAMGIRSRDVERAVIYLTNQVHHCVTKALRIGGLGEAIVRHVPMDAHFRMDVGALAGMIAADKADGLKPFLVVASTGTTDTGAVDPADQIADITEREGLWLHIDAAYGGFFLLTEEGRDVIRGLERSDSIVVDPHKGLFLPYGTGVAIVKEGRQLAESHQYTATYLQDALHHQEEMSPADISPELTRHFRGMRLWLPLKVHGLAAFRACIAEKIWLARYFWERLGEWKGMERGPYPDLSVVLYRYVPASGDADAFNEALIKRVHADGRVFLSSTRVNGKVYLRLACLSFRTHLSTIETCMAMLKEHVEVLNRYP